MNRITQYVPDASGEEFFYLEKLTERMDERQMQNFGAMYRARRRETQNVLIFTILGFFVIAGIQRFYLGQIGMGVLYLLTGGLCLVGTIIDLINHKDMTWEYNKKIAEEVVRMV